MNRIRGLALGPGVATLIVVGLACGAGDSAAGSAGGMTPHFACYSAARESLAGLEREYHGVVPRAEREVGRC